ncbi:hypothetical protein CBM2637_A60041 [Cupriavidus taiwanensis]|nr:hypothetical protein CBM2637_A60041 [Cupriavidus taiwanensis]
MDLGRSDPGGLARAGRGPATLYRRHLGAGGFVGVHGARGRAVVGRGLRHSAHAVLPQVPPAA